MNGFSYSGQCGGRGVFFIYDPIARIHMFINPFRAIGNKRIIFISLMGGAQYYNIHIGRNLVITSCVSAQLTLACIVLVLFTRINLATDFPLPESGP